MSVLAPVTPTAPSSAPSTNAAPVGSTIAAISAPRAASAPENAAATSPNPMKVIRIVRDLNHSQGEYTMRTRFLAALIACAAFTVDAQTYPTRPVKLIVGFEPGGNTDTLARIVAQKLSERLGQQVVVENKLGAAGTIGTAEAARAAPDGYTLTMGTTTTHAIAPAAFAKLAYDPVADFDPIALVANAPYLLVVQPSFPAKDLKESV